MMTGEPRAIFIQTQPRQGSAGPNFIQIFVFAFWEKNSNLFEYEDFRPKLLNLIPIKISDLGEYSGIRRILNRSYGTGHNNFISSNVSILSARDRSPGLVVIFSARKY
jgi:hypothetical protein